MITVVRCLLIVLDLLQYYSLIIYRAALGEGAAHPWQLTVQNDSTEAKIELVPATREGTDSCEKSPSQQTIGVLNPLASVMAGMLISISQLFIMIH